MRQRVLLTGGSGLLALNWALAIRDRSTVILGLHRRSVALGGIDHHALDLESVEQLAREFEHIKPDVVIHTAGMTSVERCETEPQLAQHINTELPENVAQVCAQMGVAFVHISTDHLFAGTDSLVDESHPVAPINTYGRTKANAEERVLNACPRALVIRTNFFGWGTSYRQSFSDIVIDGLRGGEKLTLFRDVYYTPILAESLALTVHELIERKASGIFNVVGDERVSKYEFGIRLAEEFGLDKRQIISGSIEDCPALVRRPCDMSLSNNKIQMLLRRGLGGASQHISSLHRQADNAVALEMQAL